VLAAAGALARPATNRLFAARDALVFVRAQKAFADHPDDPGAACALGRATYYWAEFATNADQRAEIAQAGIAACRHLLARDPNSAAGHYYLGIDYGELAEAEAPSMAAYRLIREIEHEFKAAADLDERQDFAGPLRCLGLLYRDAPGWPISIGSRHKAREFLDRAAASAPNYPENQMNLVESQVKWHQEAEAEAAWRKLGAVWPVAQTNLTGTVWEEFWSDWAGRRAAAKADFRRAFKRELEP
jgi:hypothetical protein